MSISTSISNVTSGSAVDWPPPTHQTKPSLATTPYVGLVVSNGGIKANGSPASVDVGPKNGITSDAESNFAASDATNRAGSDMIHVVLPNGISFEIRPLSGIEGTGHSLNVTK